MGADDGGHAAAQADAGVGASAGEAPKDPLQGKKAVVLQVDARSIARSRKWVAFWQKEAVAAQQEEEALRLQVKMQEEVLYLCLRVHP